MTMKEIKKKSRFRNCYLQARKSKLKLKLKLNKKLCRVLSYVKRFSNNCKFKCTKWQCLITTPEVSETQVDVMKMSNSHSAVENTNCHLRHVKVTYGSKHQIIPPKETNDLS